MSGAATGVFHRYYHEADQRPAFYLDTDARELGRRGRSPIVPQVPDEPTACPFHEPGTPAPLGQRGWFGRLFHRA
jgi:nitric-oxide synthase, bacterial